MKLTEQIHLVKIDFEISIASGKKIPRYVNAIIIFGKSITIIDAVVKACYKTDTEGLENCQAVVEKLGLPPFLVNPIVDKAFRSHLY